jgi:leucyl aminopeptidase
MRLQLVHVPELDPSSHDVIVVALRSGDPAADAAAAGLDASVAAELAAEAERVGFDGSIGAVCSVRIPGGPWVVGTGAATCRVAGDWRRVASHGVTAARSLKAKRPAFVGSHTSQEAGFAAEGALLTGYAFDKYFSTSPVHAFETWTLVASTECIEAIARAKSIAKGICLARNVANEHPGKCTPVWLAKKCAKVAERHGLDLHIRDEDDLEKEGFRLILAVGKGSENPPRLIHMVWRPEGPVKRRIALVGKGITYDSGGYSMKPAEFQVNMHLDMGGSAAVLGAAEAIGRLRPAGVEVHFIIPAAENLVSKKAYKVMEIVRGYGGKTVQIKNTDAEGRLVLADAISWARELDPDVIVDLATLTGSCVVALGNETAGLFSNDEAVAAELIASAADASERVWRMPLVDALDETLKSDVADMQNIGVGRYGGAISAACFLQRFVEKTPWAHLDIAGPAMMDKGSEHICAGGTGFGVATLVEFIERAASA